MSVTTSVPATSGRTPNFGGLNSGAHSVPVKNSTGLTVPEELERSGCSECEHDAHRE